MNRILFYPEEVIENRVVFDDVRAGHVLNVLHGSVGRTLKTGIVNGLVGTSVIEAIEPLPPDKETGLLCGRITVSCKHDSESVKPWVDLIVAPPRPRAMKRLLPQLVQMGVGRIVFVGADKVEKAFWGAQLLKEQVYRPILLDGLMQAGTTEMPTIQIEKSFKHYFEHGRFEEDFAGQHVRVVAHPYGNKGSVREHDPSAPRMVVAIGPEGGWTDPEVGLLESHGFARLPLGPRILRTDTAAIALLARLMKI